MSAHGGKKLYRCSRCNVEQWYHPHSRGGVRPCITGTCSGTMRLVDQRLERRAQKAKQDLKEFGLEGK